MDNSAFQKVSECEIAVNTNVRVTKSYMYDKCIYIYITDIYSQSDTLAAYFPFIWGRLLLIHVFIFDC